MENKAEVTHWETGVLHVSNLPMKMSASPLKPYLAVPTISPTSTERGLLCKRGDLPPQVKRYSSSVKTMTNTAPLLES